MNRPWSGGVSEAGFETLERLAKDLPVFAESCLTVRAKTGAFVPLALNPAQARLHARLEAQRAATGKVRALVLKARQQGVSTYVQARHYWRVAFGKGLQAFILAHETGASEALFAITRRMHALSPEPMRPRIGRDNPRELSFPGVGGGHGAGTAGADAVGRSKTIQLLHGSEAAFWKNAAEHFAGVVQAVPDLEGTEIIIESTANGPGGEFFERWRRAEAGIGDYLAFFAPWFWTAEYRRPVPPGFAPDAEEAEHAALHGLDMAQIAWRRAKMAELKDPMLFMQEYPATAAEAFQASGHDGFIKPEAVLRARKASLEGIGPLVLGVDPKREGTDRFAMALRRGRKLIRVTSDAAPVDALTAAGRIKAAVDQDGPARVFMDVGGPGGAIGDILRSWGEPYASRLVLVNFGSAPVEPETVLEDGSRRPGPKNRRAEMWARSRDWLEQEGGADIPDSDALQADACAPRFSYDLNQRLVLEAKERMAARGARSPDEWDAVALTFAEPVAEAGRRWQGGSMGREGGWGEGASAIPSCCFGPAVGGRPGSRSRPAPGAERNR